MSAVEEAQRNDTYTYNKHYSLQARTIYCKYCNQVMQLLLKLKHNNN